MSEVLDLSGAKLGQFDLLSSGWKDVHVENIDDIMIDNDEGKLPEGTPGYNVRFVVDGGSEDGKSAFNRFYLPLADSGYDESKRQTALGRFGDFLIAIGYSEKDIKSGKFKFDKDDAEGRKCRILVGESNGYNTVRNFKPIGADLEEGGGIL